MSAYSIFVFSAAYFFFKQKTAYEMRISDWSSDVCSSDLPRLQSLAEIIKPQRILPAAVEFVDIAGLVAGASQGEGLGNQFLGHIRETDAIAHVTRCFDDPDVIHVAGSPDPIRDIEIINTELGLADQIGRAHV